MLVDGGSCRAVPYGADQTVYVVVDKFGPADGEKEVERADLETVVSEFMAGAFVDPIRVVAFNTEERWSEDVSEDVAHELRRRCDLQLSPSSIQDFVEQHEGHNRRQLTLRLV